MTITQFPDVELADPESGFLALGGDLEPESLLLAYKNGIFPWPYSPEYLTWFAPPKRAILYFNELHIAKSLSKFIKKSSFEVTFDKAFQQVISACSEVINRGEQDGTWITSDIIKAYTRLHELGFAHSVECWNKNELVGGLYGVSINGFFAGESMFYRQSNASKVALLHLVNNLQQQGVSWIDCQVLTPLFASFGAREIPRKEFMILLQDSLKKDALRFF